MIEVQGVENNEDFCGGALVLYSIPWGGVMKALISLISTCVIILLLGVGCSTEEATQDPESGPRVVKRIIQTPPEEIEAPMTKSEKQAETEAEKNFHAIQVVNMEEAAPEAKKELRAIQVVKKVEVESEAEKEIDTIQTAKKEAPVKPAEPEPLKPVKEPEDLTGYYLAKKGDTLLQISARDDVYGSPLNWPILYRHNLEKLGEIEPGPNFLETTIPREIKLKIVTAEEVNKNIKKRANKTWVINVISTTSHGEIVAPAITLMKEGYTVYFTNATVKGRKWMRLRVGFFESKSEADKEGKKIMDLLNFVKPWTTKLGDSEHKAYVGY